MESNQSIKQAILEIDFDRTQWNDPDSLHFEGLEYVNTINIQYSEKSSLSLNEANRNYLL